MLSQSEVDALGQYAGMMNTFHTHINEVRKQPLHAGQITAAKEFFVNKRDIMQFQWGRNGGKTETILYIAWRYAIQNPGHEVYIICPEIKQGKKIYWSSKRLQRYGPSSFVSDIRESELRIVLSNGASICVDGCENFESLRGIKPHLVIYDEFQHHSQEFHIEVMEPNLLGRDCQLLVMGTPPKQKTAYYVQFRKDLLKEIKGGDKTRFYMEMPTWVNPHIDREKLKKIENRLKANGDIRIWEREYEGKLVFGGEDAVFPTWDGENKHIKSHSMLMDILKKEKSRLRWYTLCDPGSSSCFGVLFGAHNPYTAQLFLMGEIYEKDRKKTDSVSIWNQITKTQQELNPGGKWITMYDEAAAWFRNEIWKHYKVGIAPTQKKRWKTNDDSDGISIAKSMMTAEDCLFVSDRLEWFPWEVESYITDEKGDYPDKDDHLIQCFLYMISACNFRFHERGDDYILKDDIYAPNGIMVAHLDPTERWDEAAVDSVQSPEYDA
jgi:hypothetical protein